MKLDDLRIRLLQEELIALNSNIDRLNALLGLADETASSIPSGHPIICIPEPEEEVVPSNALTVASATVTSSASSTTTLRSMTSIGEARRVSTPYSPMPQIRDVWEPQGQPHLSALSPVAGR